MAVGKGSIQRATRTLKEENTEKVTFTEPKEEKAASGTVKAPAKKAPAKRGRKPGTKSTVAAKKTAAKQPAAVKKTAATQTAGKKSYQQVSHIKSELPVHLL